jgi:hypothetical protein
LIFVVFPIVVGKIVVVMFEIFSSMMIVDDGITRDNDQAVPE